MYDNIGSKIKILAKVLFIIEAVVSVIGGIAFMCIDASPQWVYVTLGFAAMLIGPLTAWISSWILYGFGELVDKASGIEYILRKRKRRSESQPIFDENINEEKEHSDFFRFLQ